MNSPHATERTNTAPESVLHLSKLLGQPLVAGSGEAVGRIDDVIVRTRGGEYPLVTGLVVKVGGRRVYVDSKRISEFTEQRVVLAKEKVDLRGFERRPGELLLREDILGHRLIDVVDVELIHAYDVEFEATPAGWVLARLDTRRPARLLGLVKQRRGHAARDWKAFEPLLGHRLSSVNSQAKTRIRRLKPAQIADLLEDADRDEGTEILVQVHVDPELEADVFEELDPDLANKLFGEMPNEEVADVMGRMRADDAADAIAQLRQNRRLQVLALLPDGHRAKVLTLLRFSPSSAGGLMSTDVLTCPQETTVAEALLSIATAHSLQEEALYGVNAVDEQDRLIGTVTVIRLLRTDPADRLSEIVDQDPVRVSPDTDVVDIALLMADYNLVTVPVVDTDNRVLGVVTVDDVLEATIPDDWRRREPAPRPPTTADEGAHAPSLTDGPPGDEGHGDV